MRKILTITFALVLAGFAAIAVFIYPAVRDTGLQATGYVAKNICSGHFVSGLAPERVVEEALRPIDETLASTEYIVDEDARAVDVAIYGLFERRAIHLPELGCVLIAPGEETVGFDLSPREQGRRSSEPWPIGEGPVNQGMAGVDYDALNAAIDDAFADPDPAFPRNTNAVVVIRRGELIAERYDEGITLNTPLISWSMAKSVTNAQLGILHGSEDLPLFGSIPVPEWQGADDPRAAITVDQMLRMSSGLEFDETYAVGTDVTRMLSLEPSAGRFAAAKPLAHEPGEVWAYSSGTSNILAQVVRETVGGAPQDHYDFAQDNLFGPIGARSFRLETDASGTHIGSSYIYATARDWARLGQLYLEDGMWNGVSILPQGWVDYSRTPTTNNPYRNYGAHFWLNCDPVPGTPPDQTFPAPMWPDAPRDAYSMNGFQGQHVVIIPSRDLVIVRLGFATRYLESGVNDLIAGVIAATEGAE